MTAPWLAFHVFYESDQDRMIVDAIAPTLRRLRANGTIARYFFIRYWNGGPHLRIRTECLQSVAETERELRGVIQAFLDKAGFDENQVRDYGEEAGRIHELEQRLAAGHGGIEPLEPIQSSGTIQLRSYRFDEMRYGGPPAMEDFHDHAWVSTEIACAFLELTKNNPDAQRVFALHAAAVVPGVLATNSFRTLEYFTRCSRLEGFDSNTTGDEQRWEDRGFAPYAAQGSVLDDVRLLVECRDPSAPEFWLLLLDAWRKELTRRREFLLAAQRAHGLPVHPDHLILDALHLFLNRLGIDLTLECYLYYLLASTLRDRITTMSERVQGALA